MYDVYFNGTLVGPPLAGTGAALSLGMTTNVGIYKFKAVISGTGCSSMMLDSAVVDTTSLVAPSVSISASPGLSVCSGTTVAYTPNPINGGTLPTYAWTVNGVASGSGGTYSYVPATADVVGVTMTSSALCATPTTTSSSVTMAVDVPTVTATATPASCGGTVTITGSGGVSYSWSPSTGLSCSTCASATLLPTVTTTYTVTGTDGSGCIDTSVVSVDGNRISGYISYTGALSTDTFTIWLIHFNPTDSTITALDSTTDCVDGGMAYYQFMDKPTGDYMVKAKLNSSVPGTSGYIPTYSLSTPHWDSAATISHSGSADTMHVSMVYGTVPAGPGFISGSVVSGAGRGTSGEVPAAGMLVYLKNGSGSIITYNYTASDGSYSFGNLAEGAYIIYPETYKYYTSPSAVINLTSGSDTVTSVNFKQHTSFGTITPYDNTKVKQLTQTGALINVYPNPANDELSVIGITSSTRYRLLNVTGNCIQEGVLQPGIGTIPMRKVIPGMYILEMTSETGDRNIVRVMKG
jgi:hypothetical protein